MKTLKQFLWEQDVKSIKNFQNKQKAPASYLRVYANNFFTAFTVLLIVFGIVLLFMSILSRNMMLLIWGLGLMLLSIFSQLTKYYLLTIANIADDIKNLSANNTFEGESNQSNVDIDKSATSSKLNIKL